jgi:hypothetical protein
MSLNQKTDFADSDAVHADLRKLMDDAVSELIRACKKFPDFPDKITDFPPELVTQVLNLVRQVNDRDGGALASADTVIREEMLEAYEAAQAGNEESARAEIVQVLAMVLRTYMHLPHYCGRS